MEGSILSRHCRLLVGLTLLLGGLVVQLIFVQPNYITGWAFVKPVSLVQMADEEGRLHSGTFGAREPWIEDSYEAHARRWGTTLLFLALHQVSGADVLGLTWGSPLGVVVFLLTLLFLFSRLEWTQRAYVVAAFLLAALGFLLNYQELIWFYHGGGWPGTSLGFLMIGALLAWESHWRGRSLYVAMVITVLLLQFIFYHATALISVMFLIVLCLYGLFLRVLFATRGGGLLERRETQGRFGHYFNLAAIAIVLFFLDPIFSFFVPGFATFFRSPISTFANFFVSYFRSENYFNPSFIGFAFPTRVAILVPLLYMLIISTCLWLKEVGGFWRGRRLSGHQFIAHGLYLTAAVFLTSALVFGGTPRPTEAYYSILLAFPLLLLGPLPDLPAAQLHKTRLLLGLGMVVTTAILLLLVLRDPFTTQTNTSASEAAAGRWAALNVNAGYFADSKLAALALISRPDTPVISPEVNGLTIETLKGVFYSGPLAFVEGLRQRGADLALLNRRNVEGLGHPSPALSMVNSPIRPLPAYDFGSRLFGMIYNSGDDWIIQLLEAEKQ
jgi:hypothetical protein